MLTVSELRKSAARSGARDIGNVEIDVMLTHILQLFHERGITEHVAFKGGTMLRKMLFGPRGRLSTDLDFTRRSDISNDDLALKLGEALDEPYRGLTFKIEKDKDWYVNEDGCAINPVCIHEGNKRGIKIKLQVSTREKPILPVIEVPQIDLDFFGALDFKPSPIPSLAIEEAIAEKIRAASQRSKIRDLHDLSEIKIHTYDRGQIRSLAVLKLWNSGQGGLNYDDFVRKINDHADYSVEDLKALLRKDQNPNLEKMILNVTGQYRFLADLTASEKILADDHHKKLHGEAEKLIADIRGETEEAPRDAPAL